MTRMSKAQEHVRYVRQLVLYLDSVPAAGVFCCFAPCVNHPFTFAAPVCAIFVVPAAGLLLLCAVGGLHPLDDPG